MNPLLHMFSLASAQAAGALFSAVWEGAVLVACVAVFMRFLPGLGAAARSVVWMNVFLLLSLLPVVPAVAEHWPASNSAYHPLFHLNPLWSAAIACAWAMLSTWRGAQLVLSAIRLRGLARRATPIRLDATLPASLDASARDAMTGRRAELCSSAEVERPCVFGFFRPRILLPLGLADNLSPLELRQVVLHEMEHLRRGDDWTNLLQKIGLVLFPLNPVLHWVERRLCAERELACDDRVLDCTGARKAYAACLTRLAEFSMLRRGFSLVLGAWERQSELVRRVHRILSRPNEQIHGRPATVLTGGMILSILAGGIALARSPQLVTFAPLAQPAAVAGSLPAMSAGQIYRQEFGGSPRLVKAVIPQGQVQTSSPAGQRLLPAAKRIVRRKPVLRSQQAWVVFTDWEEPLTPQRVFITVSQDRRSAFAAVATANGWLIVQI